MRWNRFALWVLCLLFVTGCGKDTVVPISGAVGHVVGVEGEVTAQRASEAARVVKPGDAIFASDAIVTASESNVRILLTHNGATWELGENASEHVRKSIAFTAKKNSSSSLGSKDTVATAAAGRDSNREAGETRATLLKQESKKRDDDESDGVREEAIPDAPPPPPAARASRHGDKAPSARPRKRKHASPAARKNSPPAPVLEPANEASRAALDDVTAAAAESIGGLGTRKDQKPTAKMKAAPSVQSYVAALVKKCRTKHSAGKGTLNYQLRSGKLTIRVSSKKLELLATCAVNAATNPPPSATEVSGKLTVR